MDEYETLNHTTWDCNYHFVFTPKCRHKLIFQELRKPVGEVFRHLAAQKEAKVEQGHLLPDHVHMLLSIPPKYLSTQHENVPSYGNVRMSPSAGGSAGRVGVDNGSATRAPIAL